MNPEIKSLSLARLAIATVTAAILTSSGAMAHKPEEVKKAVINAYVQEFSARQIGRKCKTISFDNGVAWQAAKDLKASLKAAGHKNNEITQAALSTSIKEQSTKATQLLVSKGVNVNDKSTYCTVGQAEIKANSAIGKFLKAK